MLKGYPKKYHILQWIEIPLFFIVFLIPVNFHFLASVNTVDFVAIQKYQNFQILIVYKMSTFQC